MFKLAAAFNDHGIPELVALAACLRFVDLQPPDPFTEREITDVVQSAYRRTPSGIKQWRRLGRQRLSMTPVAKRPVRTAEQRELLIEHISAELKKHAAKATRTH